MTSAQLTERSFTEESSLEGAVSDGIIRGVKLLGLSSKNNRRYSEQALAKAHDAKIYEGATVYVDHPQRGGASRSYRDRFARIENVTKKNTGLFGDLVFNPRHPLAEQIVWDAVHRTEGVGLSHNIVAGCRSEKGGEIIEEITKVHSVDLVDNPATTRSLFENAQCECDTCPHNKNKDGQKKDEDKKTVAQAIEQHIQAYPEAAQRLLTEMASDPVMGATMPGSPASSPEDAIKSGMRTAVMAAFDDPSLDSAETLAKIKSLLAALDAALGKEAPASDPGAKVAEELPEPKSPEGGTDPTETGDEQPEGAVPPKGPVPPKGEAPKEDDEQKKKFEQLERKAWALECLANERIKPAAGLVKELMEQTSPAAMKATAQTWNAAKRGEERPTVRTRLQESYANQSYPETFDGFVAAARR